MKNIRWVYYDRLAIRPRTSTKSHQLIASRCPEAEKAMPGIRASSRRRFINSFPVAISQNVTLPCPPVVASSLPSGENETVHGRVGRLGASASTSAIHVLWPRPTPSSPCRPAAIRLPSTV